MERWTDYVEVMPADSRRWRSPIGQARRWPQRLGRQGDLVIAISSSGNSPNIVRALDASRALALQSVTLTGMKPDNRARRLGDLNFYVPLSRYGLTESAHQVLLHHWFDQYLHQFRGGAI